MRSLQKALQNGSNDRIATFSSSTALNGEANLTFDGDFKVTGTGGSTFETKDFDGSNGYLMLSGTSSQRIEFRNTSNNANGWIGIPQMGLRSYIDGVNKLRELSEMEDEYKNDIELPTPIFPEISEDSLDNSNRMFGNGSINQIVQDIFVLEKLGVNHIYLVFYFSPHNTNLEKNFGYAKEILNIVKNR